MPPTRTFRPTFSRVARYLSAGMLVGIGGLHVSWAAGSPWPARSGPALVDAVIGGPRVPAPGPTAIVGATLVGGAIAAGLGRGIVGTAARVGLGLALSARAAVGGTAPARALGIAHPSATFRRWDRLVYRPLCAALGMLMLAGLRGGR